MTRDSASLMTFLNLNLTMNVVKIGNVAEGISALTTNVLTAVPGSDADQDIPVEMEDVSEIIQVSMIDHFIDGEMIDLVAYFKNILSKN